MNSMLSEKGFELKIVNGHKFRESATTQKGVKWRCTNKSCNSFLFTDTLKCNLLQEFSSLNHNHTAPTTLHRQILSNAVKRKAMDDICSRPTKLMHVELAKLSDDLKDKVDVHDLHRVSGNCYKGKRTLYPRIPQNTAEVHEALYKIRDKLMTSKNETFLTVNNSENNIVIFSTQTNLQHLGKADKILMDGTFDYCVKHFGQLFTIHIIKNRHYIPVAFCLLPDKQTSTYTSLFTLLVQECLKININLKPKTILVDFEQAIHLAIRSIWPDCNIIGCRFHATQAWYRKITSLGYSTAYHDNNTTVGNWLHWVFGLPFLEHEEVDDVFYIDFMTHMPGQLREFADYLTEYYMTPDSQFPPKMWASSQTEDRTTNACESFHASFKKSFTSSHPHIYLFVDVLLKIQEVNYVKFNSKESTKKNYNTGYAKRLKKLQEKRNAFNKNDISGFAYVQYCSEHYSAK